MAEPISAPLMSRLVDGIYACATDPARWPMALDRINTATGCHASVIGIVSFGEDYSLVNAVAGFDDGFAARYGASLERLSPIWGGDRQIAARPIHEPVVLSLHHPDALVPGSEKHGILCDVLGFDVEDTLNLPLGHYGRAIGAAGFARRRGEGSFEPQLYELFRSLSPHLHRSADINRLLDAQSLALSFRDGILDRLRVPVAIVDRNLRVAYANTRAADLVDGPLSLPDPAKQAVVTVLNGNSAYRCVPATEPGSDAAQLLHIMALNGHAEDPGQFAVILFASTGELDPTVIAAIAGERGLTEAETAVLRLVAEGKSTAATASGLALKASTVRTHLLRIYQKFQVHGRAELIAALAAAAPPLTPSIHQMVDAELVSPV